MQMDRFIAQLTANMPSGVAKDVLINQLRGAGLVALNNMCAYGSSADADCSSCSCNCDLTDWVVTVGTLISNDGSSIVVQSVQIDGSWTAEIRAANPGECCLITQPVSSIGASMSLQWNLKFETYGGDFPLALNHSGLWPVGTAGENAVLVFGAGTNPIGQVTFGNSGDCI